jgi:hypothetical protein
MAPRETPPFRADHVGSLLRPASTVEGNALTIDEERAKPELIVEVAEEVWG